MPKKKIVKKKKTTKKKSSKALGKTKSKKKVATKAPKKKSTKKKSTKKKASKKKAAKKKVAKKKTARKTRKVKAPKVEASAPLVADAEGWIETVDGYSLSVRDNKLVCRNKSGKQLASVPKKVKDCELGEQLQAMTVWLKARPAECIGQVELWMLRSLPILTDAVLEIWPDQDWRSALENVVVISIDAKGKRSSNTGILRDVDAKKGLGVLDEDGETRWIKTKQFAIPHPVLMDNVDDLRELLVDLNLKQPIEQLFRDVNEVEGKEKAQSSIKRFANAEFEQLNYALSACRTLGYQVSGGSAIRTVWENGESVEARYWIGADYPESQAWTGDLTFVDSDQKTKKLEDVGPVAISEGIRMASAIYAKRKVPKQTEPTI